MANVLWAMLNHYIGDDPATAKLMDPDAMNPGFLPKPAAPVAPGGTGNRLRTPPHYVEDPELQGCVALLAKRSPYSSMQFAVADLSKSPAEFAGHGAATMGYAASISKIAAMYAAHQLQFDLTVLGTQKKLTTAADLFKAARAEWTGTQIWNNGAAKKNVRGLTVQGQLVLVGGSPVDVPIHNSPHADTSGFPKLEEIFDVSAVGGKPKVEFQKLSAIAAGSAAQRAMLEYLEASDAFKAAKDALDKANARNHTELQKKRDEAKAEWDSKLVAMKFAERIFLMIDDSDNRCTARCIQNLGYCYIASALAQSGLFDVSRGGGLWLGSDYFGGPSWSPPVGSPILAATPAAMVAFLTLLHNKKLVNTAASKNMLDLMDKNKPVVPRGRGSLNRSPFQEGLLNKKYVKQRDGSLLRTQVVAGEPVLTPAAIHSKLGLDELWCDVALIQRNSKTYAAACLVAPYAQPQELIRELDSCVMANP